MTTYTNKTFDQERAFYAAEGVTLMGCTFDGPADGESAFKEATNVSVESCHFNLRYPFWHCKGVTIKDCTLTESCRAALWYSGEINIADSKLHGIKALRECSGIAIKGCNILSPEFGWKSKAVAVSGSDITGEYLFLEVADMTVKDTAIHGKYSFQYSENICMTGCNLDTKDAFWHGKNITLRDCTLKGEYLAWYSENLTLERCTVIGTQPFCYCKKLKLINCTMVDTDLAFEKSEVDATLLAPIDSIKNPLSGRIVVPSVGEIIMDDPSAKGEVITTQ